MMLELLLAAYGVAIIALCVALVSYCRKINETMDTLIGCVDRAVNLYAKLSERVKTIERMNTYIRLDSNNVLNKTKDEVLDRWERMLDE